MNERCNPPKPARITPNLIDYSNDDVIQVRVSVSQVRYIFLLRSLSTSLLFSLLSRSSSLLADGVVLSLRLLLLSLVVFLLKKSLLGSVSFRSIETNINKGY